MRTRLFSLLLLPVWLTGADWILIRGGDDLDDFEMLDHPVTNAEYKLFVDAAKHPAPLHWTGGQIPAGMEKHPVVFVNRYDAAAYLKWMSAREKRIHRLPTVAEFDHAARGGAPDARYPWGDGDPKGKANFDPDGSRSFAQWRKFLKPVKSYPPNAHGLFDMAGNVWQMVDTNFDWSTRRFIYRLEATIQKEGSIAGGSWARTEYYLRCGVRGGASAGIRYPDLGFRPVREPAGSTHFRRAPRRLIAAPLGQGRMFVGWQLLAGDSAQTGFHVYRSTRTDNAGTRLTREPVLDSTNYVDPNPPSGGRLYYRVRPVDGAGKLGPPSEWAGVEPGGERTGLIARFEPTPKQTGATPVFGDLDGDGVLDAVLKLNNGISEMSRDPGVPVEMEAFMSYGRSIWRRPLIWHDHCYGSSNNAPMAVHDMDGDGKAEVICRLQEGDAVYLAVLEGMTGRVARKTPWTKMATDFAGSSTRIHMAVAYLNGKSPSIITQTGLYENEILDAYDARLNKLWTYKSFGETNGSGSHHVDIADVDGDGRDEVFNGTMLLNPDGTVRWALYRQHPDIVAVKHILPDSKDRQVFYAVESNTHAGPYVVDAKTGKIIWKINREDDPRWTHAHTGWASDIWDGSPGMEMLTNRDGHEAKQIVLFSATGKTLMDPFPGGWRPVNWLGNGTRELMSGNGQRLGRFTGTGVEPLPAPAPNPGGRGSCGMVADLAGDFRDEVVCIGPAEGGGTAVSVYTNLEPISRREVTRTADREYRLWLARNMGAGYASYFEWQP